MSDDTSAPGDGANVTLAIPDMPSDADNLTAALAYADAGWYVLPVRRGTKDPGSIVGKRWQDKSSRDPKVIAAWYAGTDHGIALHCGRSGAVVFDVDRPENLPERLTDALKQPTVPYQSTRPRTRRRGHYIFTAPPGRTLGNGTGKLGKTWGEIRGLNGVIIAAPTEHPEGGEYRWRRGGVVPVLPDEIAAMLPDGRPGDDAATDEQVRAFLAEHIGRDCREALRGPVASLVLDVLDAQSRHDSAVTALVWAMEEARAGCYPARDAVTEIRDRFVKAATGQRNSDDKVRSRAAAVSEFNGMLAWAVGQANAKTDEYLSQRRERATPEKGDKVKSKAETDDQADDESGYTVAWRTASDVRDGIPEWAWTHSGRGRLMRNTFTLFAGRPAAGKSTAARYFAAGYTRGTVEGCFAGQPQHVAYIASEESIEYIVKPSLRAHDADLTRVHFPTVKLDGDAVRLESARHEALLMKALAKRDISVVFVDPVMSAIGALADVNRTNEIRAYLEPWQRIAERINGLVIGIVHLKKQCGPDVLAAINGSSAFGEVARGVIAFGVSEDQESRILSQEKNSAGHTDLSLFYSISATDVETDEGPTEFAQFILGDVSPLRVGDLLKTEDKQLSLGSFSIEILDAVREFDKPVGPLDIAPLVSKPDGNDMIGKYMRRLAKAGQLVKRGRGLYVVAGRESLKDVGEVSE